MSLDTDLTISQKADGLHLSNAQGIDISYTKLKVWDKNGTVLPSQILLTNNTITLQIDDVQAQYPITIDPIFQQQGYLKASNTGVNDQFGWSVAVSGDTVVVGALYEDGDSSSTVGSPNNSVNGAGAAYVFIRTAGIWSQQGYLKASNTDVFDEFGWSVAVSGDTVVVGARSEAGDSTSTVGSPNNSTDDAGAAYVFIRNAGIWSQQGYLKASNTGVGDAFGYSVAISGDTVVVGAELEDGDSTSTVGSPNNSTNNAGAAYVFAIAPNTAPIASGVNITGTATVGNMLTGNYTFSDVDNDSEGTSTFRWLRAGSPITGATASTYTLVVADSGTSITFEVAPVAATGTSPGIAVLSGAVVVANTAPVASAVNITGTAAVGNLLTGNYTYSDVDNDAEGTSTFRWLRAGSPIAGATASTYTLVAADNGTSISFEVTPVATTGTSPGIAVLSGAVVVINTAPVASAVNITGTATVGNLLTGNYTYSDVDNDLEGTSTYQWYRNGVAIAGATAPTYFVIAVDSAALIVFEVAPVAATGATIGSPVSSAGVRIDVIVIPTLSSGLLLLLIMLLGWVGLRRVKYEM